MTRRVHSFDFDGSLFNDNYMEAYERDKDQKAAIIKGNKRLLDDIKASSRHFSKQIVIVGSNRQSKRIDVINSDRMYAKTGSCFTAIKEVANYLGAELDTFLLADLYHGLEDGESFKRAISQPNAEHKDWVFDHTKASILYAQIHRSALEAAKENPKESIIFDFYDDRTDILDALNTFYSQHPELIPANVTLRLNYYKPIFEQTGAVPEKKYEIVGRGFIDQNYRETVKNMAKLCEKPSKPGEINVAEKLKVNELTGMKAFDYDKWQAINSQEPVLFGDQEKLEKQTPVSMPTIPDTSPQEIHATKAPVYYPKARDKEAVRTTHRQVPVLAPAIPTTSSSAVSVPNLEKESYAKAAESLNQLSEFHSIHLSKTTRREKWKSKGLLPTVTLYFIDYQAKTNPLLQALRDLGVTLREVPAVCYGEKIVGYNCSLESLSVAQAIPEKVRDVIAPAHTKRREVGISFFKDENSLINRNEERRVQLPDEDDNRLYDIKSLNNTCVGNAQGLFKKPQPQKVKTSPDQKGKGKKVAIVFQF